ncbi:S41 family peptidase [Maribacter sp. 2308TA10-17]|uniref:S41 family peptidase n=1 Tax=Maribacter sp. 2308TA10-17 TaxID=3386276 RepID=UPI0039BC33E0
MQKITFLLLLLCPMLFFGQTTQKKFNLDFEETIADSKLPKGWHKWGNYQLQKDSLTIFSGNYSGKIIADKSGSSFGSIAFKIPANYKGKEIRLEGYMKIENVTKGVAGLLLRLDGDGGVLQFDNMMNKGIKGSIDWKKYSITLPFPENTTDIYVAGILSGSGEAWFDDFSVFVDGKDIQTLKEEIKELSKAQRDTIFDNGSKVVFPKLNEPKLENLALLCKIWGFLKYFHPNLATGDYNWDYELFRFLPSYLAVKNNIERDEILSDWINKYGTVKECKKCKPFDKNAFKVSNLNWISDSKLSEELEKKLLFIQKNRHQGKGYHISLVKNIGNPKFSNENAYREMPYPDAGFRLLTLYRYWNIIQYYFPYKHLMDKEWNETLKDFLPRLIEAKDELEYEIATLQLIGRIQDTHANLWNGNNAISESRGDNFAPVHLRFIENQLVVVDYYNPELKETTGLEVGDVILKINGQDVDQIVKEKLPFYPASNYPTQLRDIAADMLRSNDEKCKLTFKNDNGIQQKEITLYPRADLSIYRWYPESKDTKSYKLLNDNVGYVTLQTINYDDVEQIKEDFQNLKGIVVDIRNYPSEFVPFALGSFFTSKFVPFVKFTVVNGDFPGEFSFGKNLSIPQKGKNFDGKVIVLVNELSQSQAEYTAMAFRAGDNVTIIGSTTAGADGNVSGIPLPGGISTMISGIGVYYPDGTETQRVGIVPDIEIKPTIKGVRAGKDEVLEKAIELILKE